jgi:hypothetical protein
LAGGWDCSGAGFSCVVLLASDAGLEPQPNNDTIVLCEACEEGMTGLLCEDGAEWLETDQFRGVEETKIEQKRGGSRKSIGGV